MSADWHDVIEPPRSAPAKGISPYHYIRQVYDEHPIVGEWVYHTVTHRFGMVCAPLGDTDPAYVRVRFDGDDFEMNAHPKELEYSYQPHPAAR